MKVAELRRGLHDLACYRPQHTTAVESYHHRPPVPGLEMAPRGSAALGTVWAGAPAPKAIIQYQLTGSQVAIARTGVPISSVPSLEGTDHRRPTGEVRKSGALLAPTFAAAHAPAPHKQFAQSAALRSLRRCTHNIPQNHPATHTGVYSCSSRVLEHHNSYHQLLAS